MLRLLILVSFSLSLLGPVLLGAQAQDPAHGQAPPSAGQLLLVLPFENQSTAPGLEWIGESFPEVLNQRLAEPELFIINREDRASALDRMGVPAATYPSRATVVTLAQAMDVDYVILGSYNYDGRTFTADAQVLDLRNLRLTPALRESGPLTQLTDIQTALAYDLLCQMHLPRAPSRAQFMARSAYVRLDSLESYVRGVLAATRPDKIRRFKEAVRISPDYDFAKLALGHIYFDGRDYEQAAAWFARIPQNSPQALEANFFFGICAYYLGDYARSQQAFQFVANRLPLTEVRNNLGVVSARKNPRAAAESFRRAVDTDPRDEDYRVNYALALAQTGDATEALHQVKEALALRPGDADARALLDSLTHPALQSTPVNAPSPASPAPALRLKPNYDETTFRQAELEMRNLEEISLATQSPGKHAQAHIDRGNEMLGKGFYPEAEQDFREALKVDPNLAAAHVGLARLAAENKDLAAASVELDRALALDPHNPDALNLKRSLAAHLSAPPAPPKAGPTP